MSFTRGREGVANYRYFLNVDAIAFCEGGGENQTAVSALTGEARECADLIYWERRIKAEKQFRSVAVRPLGGKRAVLEAYESLNPANDANIFFCMDRDFDDILDLLISSPSVLYSYGYSIENDISCESALLGLIRSYKPSANQARVDTVVRSIRSALSKELKKLRRFIAADLCLYITGRACLFKDGMDRFINNNHSGPFIDDVALRRFYMSTFRTAQRPRFRLSIKVRIEPAENLRGHALFDLLYCLILWAYRSEFGSQLSGRKKEIREWLCNNMEFMG